MSSSLENQVIIISSHYYFGHNASNYWGQYDTDNWPTIDALTYISVFLLLIDGENERHWRVKLLIKGYGQLVHTSPRVFIFILFKYKCLYLPEAHMKHQFNHM